MGRAVGATAPKADVYEFGRALLDAGDLDPVYALLWEAGLGRDRLRAWLLAYWCFYHVGTASWIADDLGRFWDRMEAAAGSKGYPRSSERRHFRGDQALRSVDYLWGRGADDLWADVMDAGPTAADVCAAVKRWRGFGGWIAFKAADMVERLAIRPVVFDLDTAMYDSPRKAAEALWVVENDDGGRAPDDVGGWAVGRLHHELGHLAAPPRGDRTLGLQEYETILCKHGSYLGGHYHVGEDVRACRGALARFGRCGLAQDLYRAGKKGGLW